MDQCKQKCKETRLRMSMDNNEKWTETKRKWCTGSPPDAKEMLGISWQATTVLLSSVLIRKQPELIINATSLPACSMWGASPRILWIRRSTCASKVGRKINIYFASTHYSSDPMRTPFGIPRISCGGDPSKRLPENISWKNSIIQGTAMS